MYARVIRFSDVSEERAAEMAGQIDAGEGPPPGVPAKSVTFVHDKEQSIGVVVVQFETEDDLRKGSEALDAMDAGDTPGSRISVEVGEIKAEMET
jgi:hypothetical protein